MTFFRDMCITILTIILAGIAASYLIDRRQCIDSHDPDSFECFLYRGNVTEFTTTKSESVAP